MKNILILVMCMVSWCFGAMTRDQVCIEQNVFNQASPEAGTHRGFNVWTPFGKNTDEWVCWNMTMTPVSQGSRYTVPTVSVGSTYRLTSGGTNIDVTAAAPALDTAAEVAAELVRLWNLSESADCTPITATFATGLPYVYLTGVPGVAFTVTGEVVGGAAFTSTSQGSAGSYPITYSLNTAFKCKVKAGYYLALNKPITNGSAGPVWYPTPSEGTWGAGVDVTNSAAWSYGLGNSLVGFNGFAFMSPATETRTLSLKVPNGTTRLYCIGVVRSGACTVAVSQPAATCTINDSSLNFNTDGDFVTYGKDVSFGYSSAVGHPHYKSVALVATNFTADTVLTFDPDATANMPYIVGFIAINDNATAQPDTGVFDPTTITYLMPTSYDSSGTQISSGQVTDGPIALQYGASGTATFWGNSHWSGWAGIDVVNTLVGASTYVTYDRTAFSSCTSTAYSTPTNDAEVRYVADGITCRASGAISFSDGTTDIADIGSYVLVYNWYAGGMTIRQEFAFNSGVETGDGIYLSIAGGDKGGAIATWSVSNIFNQYMILPYHSTKQTITGAYDGTYETSQNGTTIIMFSNANNVEALFGYTGYLYDASANSGYSKPICTIQRRGTGGIFNKCLAYLMENSPNTDFKLADGDKIQTFQTRTFTNTNGLEASYGRGWLR